MGCCFLSGLKGYFLFYILGFVCNTEHQIKLICFYQEKYTNAKTKGDVWILKFYFKPLSVKVKNKSIRMKPVVLKRKRKKSQSNSRSTFFRFLNGNLMLKHK